MIPTTFRVREYVSKMGEQQKKEFLAELDTYDPSWHMEKMYTYDELHSIEAIAIYKRLKNNKK